METSCNCVFEFLWFRNPIILVSMLFDVAMALDVLNFIISSSSDLGSELIVIRAGPYICTCFFRFKVVKILMLHYQAWVTVTLQR